MRWNGCRRYWLVRDRVPASVRIVLVLAAVLCAVKVPAQTVREKVEVQVVTLRVSARTHSGKPLEDLKIEDFTLSVDGRRVPIETLLLLKPSPPAGQSGAAPKLPAAASDTPASFDRVIAIVIDEGGTKSFDRRDVYDQLTKFLTDNSTSLRTLIARFDGSSLQIESPWTANPQRAIDAIARMRAHPTAERIPTVSELKGSNTSLEEVSANRRRLCRALLEALSLFPQERTTRQLIFASGGTVFAHAADISDYLGQRENANPASLPWGPKREEYFEKGQPERDNSAFALWSRTLNPGYTGLSMADVESKAVELDIALIPIAAEPIDRDRTNMPGGFAENTVVDLGAGGVLPGSTSPPTGGLKPSYRLGVAQALSSVAANTGGEAVLAPSSAAERLAEINSRAEYELTFRDPSKGDLRLHQMTLSTPRSGVTLEYRRGYRIPDAEDRLLDGVVARLVDRERPADASFSASLAGATLDGKNVTRLSVRFTPPREANPVEDRELAFVAVGETKDGKRTAPVRWTMRARRDPAGSYEATEDLGVPYGSLVWSLAVTDSSTGLVAFAFAAP
jgi:hypothetical protein